jgi:hypothetical protein
MHLIWWYYKIDPIENNAYMNVEVALQILTNQV